MRRDRDYLRDILEAARLAVSYTAGMSAGDFVRSVQTQDAVIRRIEIIGEASRRISDSTKTEYSELPWRRLYRMRNLMIHEYDRVDLGAVWETVQNELPKLILRLEEILGDLSS